jgi:glycosyltransferase involved in cell wall biosynthesis
MVDISVIIPTFNQKERLRLVLCGLENQSLESSRYEVIVVDDGCTDGTSEMVAQSIEDGECGNLSLISANPKKGRSAARNRGLEEAVGDLVVFLDGDALPAPDHLERFAQAFEEHGPQCLLCGMQYSLPELEFFKDPQTGSLYPDVPVASVIKDFVGLRHQELIITEEMIVGDFDAIRSRAKEGFYPFEESKRRQEEARALLQVRPDAESTWLAFIPHNGAGPRQLLLEAGGFDEEIPFSEGWELAYRLRRDHDCDIRWVQADTFHLYHYHPFLDPEGGKREGQIRYRAIEYMVAKHDDERIRLLYFWYAHLWPDFYIPQEAVVQDLVHFDQLYNGLCADSWRQHQVILEHHPSQFLKQAIEAVI